MTIAKRPNLARMQKLVDEFNATFPVGGWVVLRTDSDKEVLTKVKHAAYILSGHTPVAFFENVSGCYCIEKRVSETKVIVEKADTHRTLKEIFSEAGFAKSDVNIDIHMVPGKTVYWQKIAEKSARRTNERGR